MSVEVNGILVAAHELKAPLCLLRQLAFSLDLAEDTSQTTRIQNQIVEVSERALRQVNDLEKIAQLEQGLFVMEPVSVRGICDQVRREIAGSYEFADRGLELIYTNRAKLAIANRELLNSIIYNFCLNAMYYSDIGTTSRLLVQDYQGKIRIKIRDFGPALPTKIWRQLKTDSLARPTSIPMRANRSGLGLYIASEFARFMHAKIGAIRHHDGVSFYVDLPISRQAYLWGLNA